MNNFKCTGSSDDDWTVVTDQNSSTRRSATPFYVIDKDMAREYNASLNTNEVILNLREENTKLTEESHRVHIENESMAKDIKGVNFLLSRLLKTLGLDHIDQEFGVVTSSNIREDLLCSQNLTKKLLYAVENGMIQKVTHFASECMKKPEHGDGPMDTTSKPEQGDGAKPMEMTSKLKQGDVAKPLDPTSTLEGVEKASSLSDATGEATDRDVTRAVSRARLPRIEDFVEFALEGRPRKTRRMICRYSKRQRNTTKPAVLHHVHGDPRKKRWGQNRGAPRQAYSARRKC